MKSIILKIWIVHVFFGLSKGKLTCKDFDGNPVGHGEHYMPDASDLCKVCLCDKGFPTMCRSVSCSPPSCPHWVQVKNECCEFTCLDSAPSPTPKTSDNNSTVTTVTSSDSLTTLGLRLVASTVTSFLVLALLLFAVHQLRRKRLILAMRRYSESRRRTENYQQDLYSPDFFGMTCPPYEEPPPPYSPPKPPSDPHPDEAPPPYDSVDANHNVNPTTFHDPSVLQTPASSQQRTQENLTSPTISLNDNRQPIPGRNRNVTLPRQSSQQSPTELWDRNVSMPRQASRSSPDSLPPWNSFRHENNREQFSNPQTRCPNRELSESSDLESERASTDFAITSDSETHYNQCDTEENRNLRDLRLSNLLSPSRSNHNGSTLRPVAPQQAIPESSLDLQNDAHYPENSLSYLSQEQRAHEDNCKTTESPTRDDVESVPMVLGNYRNKNCHSHSQSFHLNSRNSFSDKVNEENCSVV